MMKRDGDDFQRSEEAPFDFFRLRTLMRAASMGVTTEYANESVAILRTAFGEAWLNEAAEDHSPSVPLPFRRHPLGSMISTAGPEQFSEAFELADYLRAIQDSKRLPELLLGLKAHFRQSLLQLAVAARLHIAGATDVELEPASTGGRFSDIDFVYEARQFRAECFRPTYKASKDHHNEVIRLSQDCLDVVKDRSNIFSIAVSLIVAPTPQLRKRIAALVGRIADKIDSEVEKDGERFPAVSAKNAQFHLSVCRALSTPPGSPPILARTSDFPIQGKDCGNFMRCGWADASKVKGITGEIDGIPGRSHIGVWLPENLTREQSIDQDVSKALERLGRKVEQKLAQTRSSETMTRLIVVDTWITGVIERASSEDIARLKGKLVTAHRGVGGILLVRRTWFPRLGRHGYKLFPVLSDDCPPELSNLIERMRVIDPVEP